MNLRKSAFLAACLSQMILGSQTSSVAAQVGPSGSTDCRLVIDAASGRWSIESFDLDGTAVPFRQFQLALTNTGSEPCSGSLQVEVLGEPFGLIGPGASRVPYTLVDDTAGRDLTPRAGESRRLTTTRELSIGPGETETRLITLTVDPSHIQGDGVFVQRVRLNIVGVDFTTVASRDLSLEVQVNPSVSIRLVGAVARGAVATINLGELTEGVHRSPVQLQVQSTRGYTMDITSENLGALALGETGWRAPYALLIGDDRLNLSEPASINRRGVVERLDRYDVGFEFGDVTGIRAGRYSDVITVSVKPL